ncbi:MAG: hypothetical protein WA081_09795 [Desulfosalsimonadaceae bacterium]
MTTSLQTKLQNGHDELTGKNDYLPQCQKTLDDAHNNMLKILNHVQAQKKDIRDNSDLSGEGKAKAELRIIEAGKKQMADLRAAILPGLADHRKSLMNQLNDHRVTPDNIFLQLRQREIRDLLRPLAMKDRAAAYLRACQEDDFEVIAAVEGCPRAFSLLDEKIIEGARLDRFSRKHPADAVLAENLGRLHSQIDRLCALQMRRCETLEG